MKWKQYFVDVASAMFIFLFFYAAVSKLSDFEKFQVQLGKSPLISPYSKLISIVVPMLECVIGLMFIIKRYQWLGLYGFYVMMVMFTVYIGYILKFSPYIPCSCGGIIENFTWSQHLWVNLGFIFVSIVAILINPTGKDPIAIRREAGPLQERH